MILDTLPHSSLYHYLSPNATRCFAWLAQFDPQTPDGRYDIDGNTAFALVQSYDTLPSNQKPFESHRAHLDIQYVVSGAEIIYYAPLDSLKASTAFDLEKDFALYDEPAVSTALELGPGSFGVFYPGDGHKPGCVSRRPSQVKKIVIKVKL